MGLSFEEEKKTGHYLTLKGRAQMSIEGVEEVMGFDEESVRLRSSEGELFIEGRDIKIDALDTERQSVSLTGRINGIYYAPEREKQKKGFLSRLLS